MAKKESIICLVSGEEITTTENITYQAHYIMVGTTEEGTIYPYTAVKAIHYKAEK